MIVEPMVQGAAGIKIYSARFLKAVRDLTKKYNIHLIDDEIAMGFGRTGKMFACEHAGIEPDIMCIAKGLSSGYYPIAMLCITTDIFNAFYADYKEGKSFLHSHTYSGNPLGCRIALEVLRIFKEDNVLNTINEKVSQIHDQYIEIKAGTLIAKTGEILTDRKIDILDRLGIYNYKMSIFIIALNLVFLLVISSIFNVVTIKFYSKEILEKNKYRAIMLLAIGTLLAFRIVPSSMIYLLPLDTMLLLLLFIVKPRFSVFLTMIVISYMLPITDYDLKYFTIQSIAVFATGFLSKNISTRSSVIAVGIQLAILKILLYLILSFFSVEESYGVALNTIKIFISGLFSGMLTIALLPYFERTFNILTVFKLMELADLSHPLLRKLSIEAPGTFQHSMMVATLSENAVIEIGGDPTFTRVACYYHDIGKTKRPQYYVENQTGGKNLHNDISPFMSKMIILAHTREGAEMGKKYKIPKEIRDIMFEHQGTTLLAYFYNKAKEIDPNIPEEEFRYSGPKPQTKESAVILLADSIEAAVRSLDVKDPVKVEQMVRKIVDSKIRDNQLSDANITFREVEIIVNSFLKTFGAIYHERIKYPGQK